MSADHCVYEDFRRDNGKSEMEKDYKNDFGFFTDTYDFSQTQRPFCNTRMIINLAKLVHRTSDYFTQEKSQDEGQLLELAAYLNAPMPTVQFIAQQLWDEVNYPNKNRKRAIQKIAGKYVMCPANLLAIIKTVKRPDFGHFLLKSRPDYYLTYDILNFSRSACEKFINRHNITTHAAFMIKTYGFTCLDGFKELVSEVVKNQHHIDFDHIDLSGHSLQKINLDFIQKALYRNSICSIGFREFNLSNNKIYEIQRSDLATEAKLPNEVDLSHNQIAHIHDDVFALLNQWRAINQHAMKLNLENNQLVCKDRIKNLYYKATHTLPERYITHKKYLLLFFITTYALLLSANYASNVTRHPFVYGALASGVITIVEFLFGFWMFRLAKLSHPTMQNSYDPLALEWKIWHRHWNKPEVKL